MSDEEIFMLVVRYLHNPNKELKQKLLEILERRLEE